MSLRALLIHVTGALGASVSLFQPWNASDWVASDDTVRGGRSRSSLEVVAPGTSGNYLDNPVAIFSGTLDYKTLNGSGFASQRTADSWPGADLSAYSMFVLEVPYSDGKTYTFSVKDTVLPPVNGVEQATVSWEYDFQLRAGDSTAPYADGTTQLSVQFDALVPTFRGRVLNASDVAPLNLTGIKRFNIMIRSFFGQDSQAGDFDLRLSSILASDRYIQIS